MQQGRVFAADFDVWFGHFHACFYKIIKAHIASRQRYTISFFFLFKKSEQDTQLHREIILNIGDDDALDVGLSALLHFFEHIIVTAHNEDSFRAAIAQLVLQFALGIKRVGGDGDTASFENAEIGHHKLGQIGHINDSTIPFLETVSHQ